MIKLPVNYSHGFQAVHLLAAGDLSTVDIANRLDLDVPTISQVLRKLAVKGLVIRVGTVRATGGSSATVYSLSLAAKDAMEAKNLLAAAA